ncbi:hypothetical protein [Roseateles saccharophilus]|uniref:Toxin CptA n=1 Tax=Roseateles saccharophilus TaxID=304 RepID=A0A4R3UNH9_ROSSA|nr:hypothetical protein [Roseateles saccharophilus]MDG0833468.1 hypothetical protein [Roseateles saccharophilus]TCU92492.1 hypothetical protein EV671_10225 [Roseateles saccharophilus]
MRRTPPVVVQLSPQPAVQAVVALIATLASGGLAVWAISHQDKAWPVLLVVPFVALWAWWAAAVRPRSLRWDGQARWLAEPHRDDETAVQVAVLIDLDAWLLLRAGPGPRWLARSRHQQAAHWGALRATLFAAPAVPQ